MAKDMILIDMIDEQLLTPLTDEQGANVAGGGLLKKYNFKNESGSPMVFLFNFVRPTFIDAGRTNTKRSLFSKAFVTWDKDPALFGLQPKTERIGKGSYKFTLNEQGMRDLVKA